MSLSLLAISTPALAAGGIGLAIALVAYAVLSHAEEKSVVRESLRQLDGYEVESSRDQELMDPLLSRILGPVGGVMNRLGRRFTPTGYVDTVRAKFIRAGFNSVDVVDRFMAIKVGMALLVPVLLWFTFIFNPLGLKGLLQLAFFVIFAAAFVMGPDSWVNRRVEDRQKAILANLPDVLDLLTISVEAGLGFEQALDRVIGAVPGPLTMEFSRMLGETRAGASRSDAMKAMDQRIDVAEVRSFVMAIIQADTFGVSIGRVLRAQAEEMRIKRRQIAQEKAQKAPVKMLIPMVFCIFPALFVIVLGPAMINISRAF
ncbi:MAG: type II secretion system F family protein [Acidimicrobiia bacterium]|nr:type II secretion system F family protein [Acidimicrobiia bacterium]MDH5238299.1 type II secretion system F family protein [Acidimicrobiia bacterium]